MHEACGIRLHRAPLSVDVVVVFVDCTLVTGTAWVLKGRHQGDGVDETDGLAAPALVLHFLAEVHVIVKSFSNAVEEQLRSFFFCIGDALDHGAIPVLLVLLAKSSSL